jgi:hypothetical protein
MKKKELLIALLNGLRIKIEAPHIRDLNDKGLDALKLLFEL